MDIYTTIFEVIDTRSFSSMWFWIVLAIFWSLNSHFTLGVPFDLVLRASRRNEPADWADLEALTRINAQRLLVIGRAVGLVIAAVGGFILAVLVTLGFFYGVEFCQALFLLLFPFSIVALMSQRLARRILEEAPSGPELARVIKRQRLKTQAVGMMAIFVTAFWGIWQAMNEGIL